MVKWLRGTIAVSAISFGALTASAIAASAVTGPVVIRDVQSSTMPYGTNVASDEQPNTEVEPSIAVNPAAQRRRLTRQRFRSHLRPRADLDHRQPSGLDQGRTQPHQHHWRLPHCADDGGAV